jgi:heptosyltransferase-2
MPAYYAELLDLLGLPPVPERGQLHVSMDEDAYVDGWLQQRGIAPDAPLVLLNAGASFGASKLWVAERFAAAAQRLREGQGLVPVFLAGPAEVDLVRGIARQANAVDTTDPVLLLSHLKALVRRARLLVTTDTGPRHIAVAFGVPVVCLIGPTDRRYTDYALDETIVIRKDIECAPCHRKVCPLGHHNCMRWIEVDEVVAACERLLRGQRGPVLAAAPGA